MFSVCLRWILRNVCATLFLGIKKALTLRKCLIYLVPGGEVESPHTYVRWILRVLERDFHRKISIGYLPYFRGVERGAERTVKSFYTAMF